MTGTYTINTTTGMFLGGDVFVNLNGTVSELSTVNYINPNRPGSAPAGIELLSGTTITFPFLQFDLAVPVSLVGYTGGIICSDTVQEGDCRSQGSGLTYASGQDANGNYEGFIQITNGTLTPIAIAATPEPSGFVLMGTGLVGVAGVARRRWRDRVFRS